MPAIPFSQSGHQYSPLSNYARERMNGDVPWLVRWRIMRGIIDEGDDDDDMSIVMHLCQIVIPRVPLGRAYLPPKTRI